MEDNDMGIERNWNVIIEIVVSINCESEDEAVQKVKDQYPDCEIMDVS